MAKHEAACSCGQLRVTANADPIRVTICHCLACQRRTGSVFAVGARFARDQVEIAGEHKEYVRISDAGEERRNHFCPECGGTVFYEFPTMPEFIAVPVGAFADPSFTPPMFAVWDERRHPWVVVPETVEQLD